MINRYSAPADIQYMNTYVPLPFEQLYTLGKQAKEDVDNAMRDLSGTLDKWSDFRSPSLTDTQKWYELTTGRLEPIIDELVSNPDLLKSAAGRAKLYTGLNNVDRASLSALQQSRDAMLEGQKYRQQLAASGKYNPLWHDVDFANFDTLGSGQIFDDISPLAYSSIQELVDPYLKGIQDSFISSDGGYDYYGVTPEQISGVLDQNWSGILNTPEAQKHMQIYMQQNPGATAEEAQEWFTGKARQDASKYARVNRSENKFALEEMKFRNALAKKLAGAKGDNLTTNQFSTKLALSMKSAIDPLNPERSYTPQERAVATFTDDDYRNSYLEASEKPRSKAAKDIVNELFVPIGTNIKFINDAELNPDTKLTGIDGQPLYPGTGIPGVMTQEQYVNAKFGVNKAGSGWNDDRIKFETDLISGNIPYMAHTPKDKVLVENDLAGTESFSQEYVTYVPVSYFRDAFPQWKKKRDDNKLLNDKQFKQFMESLNATVASPSGELVARNGQKLSEDRNSAYERRRSGLLGGDDTYDIAKAYSGKYIAIPTTKNVLSNPQTRERANTEEYLYNNLGTKVNTSFREANEEYIYE